MVLMSRGRGGRKGRGTGHGRPLSYDARTRDDDRDSIVLFSPRDEGNIIRWGTPWRRREMICEDELNRWRFEWAVALRELEEIDATPEMTSTRLAIVDVQHDVDRLARMYRSFAKGARTIGDPGKSKRMDDIAEELERRYDGIDLVS